MSDVLAEKNNGKCDLLAVCVCVLLFNMPIASDAATAGTANQYFDDGVRAAQQQQYKAALKAFENARQAGLDTPELDYNVAVVYYQLGKYEHALDRFQRLTDDPQYAAVAYYNLGLISLKQGDVAGAKKHLTTAHDLAADENLKALSLLALQRIGEKPAEQSPFSEWAGLVSIDAGYDDNVALIDEDLDQSNGIGDANLEVFATANRMLWGSVENGVHFDGNVDVLKQQSESDYDYSQWHLALSHEGIFNRWETRVRTGIDRTRFGNADFQQLLSLELRTERAIGASTGIEVRYKYVDIDDRSPGGEYNYLEGNRQQLRLRLKDLWGDVSLKFSYELQYNDRNDLSYSVADTSQTTAEVYKSYSPLRHSAQISVDVPLKTVATLSFDAQYRYSYYGDPNTVVITNDNTGAVIESASLNREDQRYRVNIGMAYHLSRSWDLFADYEFTKNDSNLEGSDYDRTLVRAGITWFY